MIGPSCIDTSFTLNVFANFTFALALPVISVAVIAVFYWLKQAVAKSHSSVSPPDPVAFVRNGFYIVSFLYPGIASMTCAMLQPCVARCTFEDEQNCQEYLASSLDVECHTPAYDSHIALAWVAFFVLVLGYPAFIAYLLYHYKPQIKRVMTASQDGVSAEEEDLTVWVRCSAFFYEPFHTEYHYYHLFEIAKESTLTGFIMFIPTGSYTQLTIAIALVAYFIWALERYKPYLSESDHNFDQFGQVINGIILLLGITLRCVSLFTVVQSSHVRAGQEKRLVTEARTNCTSA